MHKSAPLLYSYMLAPTRFGSSLPSSGIFWIRLSYVKIQIDMVDIDLYFHCFIHTCWLLHILAVVYHLQGASGSV
jgi:hypothetical protein